MPHLYADDTKIYMSLSDSNAKEFIENLQHCFLGVWGLDEGEV